MKTKKNHLVLELVSCTLTRYYQYDLKYETS